MIVAKSIDTRCANTFIAQSSADGLAELEAALSRSPASWKLVVGHHPVISNGAAGDTRELVEQLEPLLIRHKVCLRWQRVWKELELMLVRHKLIH